MGIVSAACAAGQKFARARTRKRERERQVGGVGERANSDTDAGACACAAEPNKIGRWHSLSLDETSPRSRARAPASVVDALRRDPSLDPGPEPDPPLDDPDFGGTTSRSVAWSPASKSTSGSATMPSSGGAAPSGRGAHENPSPARAGVGVGAAIATGRVGSALKGSMSRYPPP